MKFLGLRVWDEFSKSWGQIVGVEKTGYVIQRFRIYLDSGVEVKRSREDLFVKPKRKPLHMKLAWDRDAELPESIGK